MPEAAKRLDRARRNGVDADVLGAEIGREIAHRGLERGLGDAHDIVVRHPFLGAVIGERQKRTAFGHELFGPLRDGREGIAGDQERFGEVRLGRLDIAAGELVLVGEGDAMDDEVERAPELPHFVEDGVDGRAVGDVAMADDRGVELLARGSTRFFRASP